MEVERLAATGEVCVRTSNGTTVRLDEAVPGVTVDGLRALLEDANDGELHVR